MLARDCAFYPTIRLQMINLCFHLALVYGPHIQRKKRKRRFRTCWAIMKEDTLEEQILFRLTTEQQPDVKSKNQTWFRVWSKSAVSNFDVAMARRAKGLPAGCSGDSLWLRRRS